MEVEKEVEVLVGDAKPYTCQALLDETPEKTVRIKLSDFGSGKYIAAFDHDLDEQWDDVCVPLFPPKKKKIRFGYSAVLVHFQGVTNQEQLDALIDSGELETKYWPRRQELDNATHSKLAQSYKNLDFSNSVVLHHGYQAENPLLGKTSLQLSKLAGAISLGLAVLTLLTFLFKRSSPRSLNDLDLDMDGPVTNRAGLPIG